MKYIASWSGGKDSTASILLAHEHNEPIDLIIFSEVMFDKTTSGELPEHIDFIKNKAIPIFESWGYEVKILRSDKTYLDSFYQIRKKSIYPSRVGMRQGFPMMGTCDINSACKMAPIRKYFRQIEDFVQYVGIAVDEPVRMERIANSGNKVSLLEKYGYTEHMALELCKKYGLLSPIYEFTNRGGCWFCPNARHAELKHLRTNHPDLWQKLLNLENEPDLIGNMWNTLTKTSIHDWEERFFWEEQQMSIFDFMERNNNV